MRKLLFAFCMLICFVPKCFAGGKLYEQENIPELKPYFDMVNTYQEAGLSSKESSELVELYLLGETQSLLSEECEYYEMIVWKCETHYMHLCNITFETSPPTDSCAFTILDDNINPNSCICLRIMTPKRILVEKACFDSFSGPNFYENCMLDCGEGKTKYAKSCCNSNCVFIEIGSIQEKVSILPAICSNLLTCEDEDTFCLLSDLTCDNLKCYEFDDVGIGNLPKVNACNIVTQASEIMCSGNKGFDITVKSNQIFNIPTESDVPSIFAEIEEYFNLIDPCYIGSSIIPPSEFPDYDVCMTNIIYSPPTCSSYVEPTSLYQRFGISDAFTKLKWSMYSQPTSSTCVIP